MIIEIKKETCSKNNKKRNFFCQFTNLNYLCIALEEAK